MFSADSRLSRLTLFPVYLHYPGSGCSLALDSRHNLSRWLWVLMRTPPDMIICWSLLRHSPSLHVTVSAVTQSASVPRHVSQHALSLVRRPTGALSLVRCHVCHGWGRNYYKWLRSRALMPRSWPGGPDPDQRVVRWGEVRWGDLWERGEWPAGSSGAILVWARCKQAPASQRGGKYLISGTNIQMKNVQREDLQTLNKIPSFIHGCRYLF